VTEVDTYLKREDSVEIRLLQAQLLVQQKQLDRADSVVAIAAQKKSFPRGDHLRARGRYDPERGNPARRSL